MQPVASADDAQGHLITFGAMPSSKFAELSASSDDGPILLAHTMAMHQSKDD